MRRLAVLAFAAATLALAACGGGEDAKLLPGTTAAEITENLESVKQLAGEGECVGAANAAQGVNTQVEALEGVDPKLVQALQRGAQKLTEVVATCEEETTEAIAPADEAPPTEEETTKLPPGQEKKEEKEREKEESKAEKEAEKQEEHEQSPVENAPEEPPATAPPTTEGGGTDAPGGVSPGTPAESEGD
jgi:hypothetical protein